MPKKGPGGPNNEKPIKRPCCQVIMPWPKLWKGSVKLRHFAWCNGKRTKKIKYHALNHAGLEMELDA